jgi:hypothetical protein
VFETARNLGFAKKAGAVLRVVGALALDFLEGDLAVQLRILSNKDFAKPALGMRTEDAKTQAGRGLFTGHERSRGVRIIVMSGDRDLSQAGI